MNDKEQLDEGEDYGTDYYDGEEEEEEEEEEVIMDEEEMLRMLDKMEPPLSVCQRLLKTPPKILEEVDAGDGEAGVDAWRILSPEQRQSLSQRGFVVLDSLAPVELASEAYDEALARASAGFLTPAHGAASGSNEHKGQHLTGYVRSVRDDLTAFISAGGEKPTAPEMAREKQEGGVAVGAIARVLDVLARLGEDIGRMVRLEGRVEHQLAVYPAGINARYERHRDAYPDDGAETDEFDEEKSMDHEKRQRTAGVGSGSNSDEGQLRKAGEESIGQQDSRTTGEDDSESHEPRDRGGKQDAAGGSVSFRRITVICYLRGSRTPWTKSDGGALRLYPPATTAGDEKSSGNGVVVLSSPGSEGKKEDVNGVLSNQEQRGDASSIAGTAPCSGSHGSFSDGSETDGTRRAANIATDDTPYSRNVSSAVAVPKPQSGECRGCAGRSVVGGADDDVGFIDVAPLAGRGVVFFSGAVEHEVLPVVGALPRAAVTTWFH